jgi:hypothetical protein
MKVFSNTSWVSVRGQKVGVFGDEKVAVFGSSAGRPLSGKSAKTCQELSYGGDARKLDAYFISTSRLLTRA